MMHKARQPRHVRRKSYLAMQTNAEHAEHAEHAVQGLVKRFFNEKEVTSTLVMDALFSGCKQVEEATRASSASKVCNWLHKCQ